MNEAPENERPSKVVGGSSRATEYVVIAAIILVIAIGAVTLLGERTSGLKEESPAGQVAPVSE